MAEQYRFVKAKKEENFTYVKITTKEEVVTIFHGINQDKKISQNAQGEGLQRLKRKQNKAQ